MNANERESRNIIFVLFFLTGIGFTICSPLWAFSADEARIFNREGVLLAQRGDIEGSIQAFERAVKADPQDDTARSNLATAYNNLGVHLSRKGKYSMALDRFEAARAQKPEDLQVRLNLLSALVSMKDVERVDREAKSILSLRPNDSPTILKIANAFLRIEDGESARNLLERVISTDPNNAEAFLSLGRLYYQIGNLSEARFNLQRSLEISPINVSASNLLQRIGREEGVETKFERESSIHFSMSFEEKISRDWMKDLLDLFEEAYSKIGDHLGFYPSQRASVIVYSPEDFQKISQFPGWAGGLYDGKIRLPVPPSISSPDQLRGAVFHEYTHHLVHNLTDGRCPTWLNEGLAQLMEGTNLNRARNLLVSPKSVQLPSLKELAGPFSNEKKRSKAERLYAQSLLAVAFLVDEKGFPTIQPLLANLAQRQSIDEALSGSFGYTCESLDSRLKESLEQ